MNKNNVIIVIGLVWVVGTAYYLNAYGFLPWLYAILLAELAKLIE